MAKNQKVSVIIPCYRQARYLAEAIDSVLGQTYPDIEIVVVNDGSDDDTAEVAGRYGARIIYHYQENRGLASARNQGVLLAQGQYVQFLDADDVIYKEKLEKQMALFERDPSIGVCLSDYCIRTVPEGRVLSKPRVAPQGDMLRDISSRWEIDYSIPIHAALFRRDIWRGAAPFDERLQAREDWVMWAKLAVRASRFGYVDEVLAEYRIHGAGMSRNWKAMHSTLIEAAEIIRPELPASYRPDFDDHVTRLLMDSIRNNFLCEARDYRSLYFSCQSNYQLYRRKVENSMAVRLTNSKVWRLAKRLALLAGWRANRMKEGG